MKGLNLPVPTGITKIPPTPSVTAVPIVPEVTAMKSVLPKKPVVNKPVEKKNLPEPPSRTCGMSHIVTTWTDTHSNERISVAMILPSGINPGKKRFTIAGIR